ncbi:helix-turn-helix domain-containing protein [Pedobacter sp. UBA5917]|jgi:AraC-like DNA-binding protein|uniref:helix-turn-helix domain-containing protein n=1 Tax=Pedobacter sp. UBA5917 TaxID=1947061 RepID=UPI0025FE6064|nr:helix-turn-helix domain-containing protein [Pedobacter sp. UBA5917]
MQFVNFLAGTTCFCLLLISLHLFFAKNGSRTQNILLSILLFARFGQVLNSLFITTGRTEPLSIFFQFFTPFYFAAPACFYLYITGFVYEKTALSKRDWFHFIPSLLAIIHIIPWPGSEALNWELIVKELHADGYLSLEAKSGLFPSYIHSLFRPLLTMTYLGLTWFTVVKSKILKKNIIDHTTQHWAIFLLKIATFFQLLGLLPVILRNISLPIENSIFVVINCAALLLILLYALHKPSLFYGFLLVAIDWSKNEWKEKLATDHKPTPNDFDLLEIMKIPKQLSATSKKINLSEEQIALYINLIKKEMEDECLYLNQDLQIIDVATRINIPVHQCSFVINNHIGKNFRDWINSYRIAYFLKQYPILADKITIEAIAQEAGFKNQATFYNAFKKEKGVMPTAYFSQELNS